MFSLITNWFVEIDLWRIGDRGLVVEVGQQDKELPLELLVFIGDIDGTDSVALPE